MSASTQLSTLKNQRIQTNRLSRPFATYRCGLKYDGYLVGLAVGALNKCRLVLKLMQQDSFCFAVLLATQGVCLSQNLIVAKALFERQEAEREH